MVYKKIFELSRSATRYSTPTNKKTYNQATKYVKSRVLHWPSAYASGMVVKRYKMLMAKKGQKPYVENKKNGKKLLSRWFKEKWIDIATGKPCGSVRGKMVPYPTCRPSIRISKGTPVTFGELSRKQIKNRIQTKMKKYL